MAALLLLACSRESAPPPAATAAPSAPAVDTRGAQLLLAASRESETEWLLVDARSGDSRSLGRSNAGAELLALDDAAGEFYFRSGDAIWRDSWRALDAAATRLAAAPPVTGELNALWVDAASGSLHALEMREPGRAEAKSMKAEPPDARPYWAILWSLRNGTWMELDKRATAWGVDGSLGPTVFDDLRRERGRSMRSVDNAASCVRLCDISTDAPAGVEPGRAEEWRELPASGTRVVFGVALGDSWHPVGPVVIATPAGQARSFTIETDGELRLLLNGAQLLIAPASGLAAALVVDLRLTTGRSLPAGTGLPVWVD